MNASAMLFKYKTGRMDYYLFRKQDYTAPHLIPDYVFNRELIVQRYKNILIFIGINERNIQERRKHYNERKTNI